MNFRILRRWLPLVTLVVISAIAWRTADDVDIDGASNQAVFYQNTLATPVLSARRIPETVRAPIIDENLQPAIAALIAGSAGNQICLSVEVDGRQLASVDQSVPLVPASNQKILTTFAALNVLGPDHVFTTKAATTAPMNSGVLEGNLFLVGGGDPFLSTSNWWSQYEQSNGRSNTSLENLADQVVATGLTEILGSVIGDESMFDSLRSGPWPQRLIDQKQSGPLSALSVNEGHLDGWPTEFLSVSQRQQAEHPALHAAQVFSRLLEERGVTISTVDVGTVPEDSIEIATIDSPRLLDTITHINSYSNNFGAEILLKHLGVAGLGEGSTEAGAQIVFETLLAQGFPMAGISILDGSGLADGIDTDGDGILERDLLTCGLISDLLDSVEADSDFALSLSVGGERGSLSERFESSPAAGQVLAKTGTLNDVTALSGYVESIDEPGTTLIFSYLVNGREAGLTQGLKDLQRPFVEQLAAYPVGPSVESLTPLPVVPTPQTDPNAGSGGNG